MNYKRFFCVFLCVLLVSCASTRPNEYTDYQNQLIAPEVADQFILQEKRIFEEASLGVMLKYQNRDFPADKISVYVYPIRDINWDDQDATLQQELKMALLDIDGAIEAGHYKSRDSELFYDVEIKSEQGKFSGKKATLTISLNNDVLIYSDIYLFMAEDKYIKFRTSYDSRLSNQSMGDEVVQSILPLIVVPPESPYMKTLRAEIKKKSQDDLMRLLKEAYDKSKTTN
jgi:hypothetical protein